MLDANSTKSKGFVWLVGAGPGASDLITVRGLKLLQAAEAVVYDDLANDELLKNCPAGCDLHAVQGDSPRHGALAHAHGLGADREERPLSVWKTPVTAAFTSRASWS